MSWIEMEPFVRTARHAKAAIKVTSRGASLWLSFSEPFYREMGSPETVRLLAGGGDHAGKILLRVDAKGKHSVKSCNKGGARLVMPVPPMVPDGARDGESCTVEQADGGWVIALPLAAWAKQIAPAPVPNAPAAPRQTEPVPLQQESKPKVRALSYLIARDHEVARTKSGFVLDGELCDLARITQKVNDYQRKAGLPDVTAHDLVLV